MFCRENSRENSREKKDWKAKIEDGSDEESGSYSIYFYNLPQSLSLLRVATSYIVLKQNHPINSIRLLLVKNHFLPAMDTIIKSFYYKNLK